MKNSAFAGFLRWLDGDPEILLGAEEMTEQPDVPRDSQKQRIHHLEHVLKDHPLPVPRAFSRRNVRIFYAVVSVVCCLVIISCLLLAVSDLPRFGVEHAEVEEVTEKYVLDGLEETGAVNIVSGIILDYRAFDTLGESFVLFCALNCVLILLRTDSREEEHDISYYSLSGDDVLRKSIMFTLPLVLVFGVYVLLNGHLSPGGGFSGGAVMGGGLILLSTGYGGEVTGRFITERRFKTVCFIALSFYCLSKSYVFFTGANGLEAGISLGTPGAILSSGLILPLNIAVDMVVTCTMYGIYRMFKKGSF